MKIRQEYLRLLKQVDRDDSLFHINQHLYFLFGINDFVGNIFNIAIILSLDNQVFFLHTRCLFFVKSLYHLNIHVIFDLDLTGSEWRKEGTCKMDPVHRQHEYLHGSRLGGALRAGEIRRREQRDGRSIKEQGKKKLKKMH